MSRIGDPRRAAAAIARAFLFGWPNSSEMVRHAGAALGYPWTFLYDLADRALAELFRGPPLPPLRRLTELIRWDPVFLALGTGAPQEEGSLDESDREALARGVRLEVHGIYTVRRRMRPARPWPVPSIPTLDDLEIFLRLPTRELEHYTRRRERARPPGPLRNYSYRWLRRRGKARLIEAPKSRLKRVQQRIHRLILTQVPLDDAAHGFRRGRSALSHAKAHAGRRVVLRMDLAEFFPSISAARVIAIFHTLGYPEAVARALGLLTTNSVPAEHVRADDLDPWLRTLLQNRHLPSGAPTSPAIANLVAFHLDRRLTGLASAFGAEYSRYADDLVFSGDRGFERRVIGFIARVSSIVRDEGFRINPEKTALMRQGARQHIGGLVVNEAPNVPRRDLERLEAILTNCVRRGAAAQNRDGHKDFKAHLRGKIAYVEMVRPDRARKLMSLFSQIRW